MSKETKFHAYTEAKTIISEIKEEYADKITISEDMTLPELLSALDNKDLDYTYEYSCYTHDLLNAVATEIALLDYFEDINEDGIRSDNVMWINRAIFDLIHAEYGDKPLSYFDH